MRYYVTNENLIPLHEQPQKGYTKLQAVERAQREVKYCIELFGGSFKDYKNYFHIMDSNFHYVEELDNAI